MYELLQDSHAGELYMQAFLDRCQQEHHSDLDNGAANDESEMRRNSQPLSHSTANHKKVSNRLPRAMANPDKASFKFMTPLDYVRDKKKPVADFVEKQLFLTEAPITELDHQASNSHYSSCSRFYSTH